MIKSLLFTILLSSVSLSFTYGQVKQDDTYFIPTASQKQELDNIRKQYTDRMKGLSAENPMDRLAKMKLYRQERDSSFKVLLGEKDYALYLKQISYGKPVAEEQMAIHRMLEQEKSKLKLDKKQASEVEAILKRHAMERKRILALGVGKEEVEAKLLKLKAERETALKNVLKPMQLEVLKQKL